MALFRELKRRNVLRMAALYLVAAWLVMQVAEVLIGLANLPEWIGPAILALLAIGFPIALVLSWFYELTPEGISLDQEAEAATPAAVVSHRRVDVIIIALLSAALLMFAWDKWWIGPPPEQSIAVLAFENLSGDPHQEYFADGLSEEILNLLAQLPDLTVISRSSAFSFKGKDVPIPEIAEQLNVAHVLEGSVRRAGDRIRITAQLIEARSDAHLWSQTYDRELDDIFAVQDEIAAAISDELKIKLTMAAGESVLPAVMRTANREAYDTYLQGRELIHTRVEEDLKEGIRHLEQSISLDNSFAPAHAQLAIATLLYHGYGDEVARRIAARHLNRAQELEPDLAEAHAGWALYSNLDDNEAAIGHARKALAVNPNYIDAMHWLANALVAVGRGEEADEIRERMLVTDPLSFVARRYHARQLMFSGRYDEAHEVADRVIESSPSAGYGLHAHISFMGEGNLAETLYWGLQAAGNNWEAYNALFWVGEYAEARRLAKDTHWLDAAEGHWDEAIRASREILLRHPESELVHSDTANVLYLAGRFEEAQALYERAIELAPEGQPLLFWMEYYMTQLALARRKTGDEAGAQAAAAVVRQAVAGIPTEHTRWIAHLYRAMIAAFDHDRDASIVALRSSIRHGLRWSWYVFDDPLFDDLRGDPRFVALRQELDEILAEEHARILQLVCFNNPAPDEWQPLPETCEGVVEQPL